MDVTPGNTPPKRSRAKTTASPVAAKPARKKLTAARKQPTKETVVEAPTQLDQTDLRGMIEREAFLIAEARSFAPGRELDDWLEAERRIRAQLS